MTRPEILKAELHVSFDGRKAIERVIQVALNQGRDPESALRACVRALEVALEDLDANAPKYVERLAKRRPHWWSGLVTRIFQRDMKGMK
jgi:hypothetical protein